MEVIQVQLRSRFGELILYKILLSVDDHASLGDRYLCTDKYQIFMQLNDSQHIQLSQWLQYQDSCGELIV